MVRKRKQKFLQNAHRAFDADFGEKAGEGKAARLKRKNDQLLIHRALTLARDFPPRWIFRQIGEAIPSLLDYN